MIPWILGIVSYDAYQVKYLFRLDRERCGVDFIKIKKTVENIYFRCYNFNARPLASGAFALPNQRDSGSANNLIHRNYLGVAQFGSALEWGSRGRKFKSSHSDQYGQLTQLVECLRHMEEARGSSPLLPTKNSLKRTRFRLFFIQTEALARFGISSRACPLHIITALPCIKNLLRFDDIQFLRIDDIQRLSALMICTHSRDKSVYRLFVLPYTFPTSKNVGFIRHFLLNKEREPRTKRKRRGAGPE